MCFAIVLCSLFFVHVRVLIIAIARAICSCYVCFFVVMFMLRYYCPCSVLLFLLFVSVRVIINLLIGNVLAC